MKFYQHLVLATLVASTLSARADHYTITFKGIKLGEIQTLQTLKKHYLDAKVTNFIAKILLRKNHFVFYDDYKPIIKDAKFRKDKNKILFVLSEAITHRPTYKKYILKNKKEIVLTCRDKQCSYIFKKRGSIKGEGIISFDKNNQFYLLKEKISDVVISRSK